MTQPRDWNGPTLTSSVVDWISRGIVSGRWSVGDRLRELQICEELGVSRAPVREAIKILGEQGLVTHQPRMGAVVNRFTSQTVLDVYEMRALIESWVCRHSVPNLSDGELMEMRRLLRAMEEASSSGQLRDFFNLSWSFREALYSAASNTVSFELIYQLRGRLYMLPQVLRSDPVHAVATLETYREVLDAANARDSSRVAEIVASFLRKTGREVCEKFATVRQEMHVPDGQVGSL